VVLRPFSQARAWRPAVVARLARTLGIRNAPVPCSTRKCAFRRERSSHEAAEPPAPSSHRLLGHGRLRINTMDPLNSVPAAQVLAHHESQLEEAALLRLASDPDPSVLRWLSAAFRPTSSYQTSTGAVRDRREGRGGKVGCSRGAHRRRGLPRVLLSWRGSGSRIARMQLLPLRLSRALMPNPSLKPSPNSVPRQPASAGPAAHFALAVRHATLSVPS
jgi:hypothetical protein